MPSCYDPPTNLKPMVGARKGNVVPRPGSGKGDGNECAEWVRVGSGSAAESARRSVSRERQGRRRRMYQIGFGLGGGGAAATDVQDGVGLGGGERGQMGSGSAAESARRPTSRELQGQRRRILLEVQYGVGLGGGERAPPRVP